MSGFGSRLLRLTKQRLLSGDLGSVYTFPISSEPKTQMSDQGFSRGSISIKVRHIGSRCFFCCWNNDCFLEISAASTRFRPPPSHKNRKSNHKLDWSSTIIFFIWFCVLICVDLGLEPGSRKIWHVFFQKHSFPKICHALRRPGPDPREPPHLLSVILEFIITSNNLRILKDEVLMKSFVFKYFILNLRILKIMLLKYSEIFGVNEILRPVAEVGPIAKVGPVARVGSVARFGPVAKAAMSGPTNSLAEQYRCKLNSNWAEPTVGRARDSHRQANFNKPSATSWVKGDNLYKNVNLTRTISHDDLSLTQTQPLVANKPFWSLIANSEVQERVSAMNCSVCRWLVPDTTTLETSRFK